MVARTSNDLVWVHACHAPTTAADLADVVNMGLRPGPSLRPNSTTLECEAKLGIAGPNLYFYLNRVDTGFGAFGVAIPPSHPDLDSASMTPFDTGGLIHCIHPVAKKMSDAEKASYVRVFSFAAKGWQADFQPYPTLAGVELDRYIDRPHDRPSKAGPHEYWIRRSAKTPKIYKNPRNKWKAWSWELRVARSISLSAPGVKWACDNATYENLLELVIAGQISTERFQRGGLSALAASPRGSEV